MGDFKGRALSIVGIATVAWLAAGCGGGGGTADTGPEIPTTGADETATDVVFAVDQFFLGETDWSTTRGIDAWKRFGINLDGLVSTKLDANHCKFAAGADVGIQIDGDDGLDNSFGQNITPFIERFEPDPSNSVNTALTEGDFTTLLRVRDLNATGDQGGMSAGLYAAAPVETPAWDGTDVWPVYTSSTSGEDIDKPTTGFDASWVLENEWNSGKTDSVIVPIVVSGIIFPINLSHASITMKFNADRSEVTEGIIAGIIDPLDFIEELRKVAGSLEESFCEGALFDSIATQIRQSADIMDDSTNGDPGLACNAISIGLGFTAKRAGIGEVVADPDEADPCAE